MSEEEQLSMLQRISSWTDEERADFAVRILLETPSVILPRISSKLQAILHRDHLSGLPPEIITRILSCTDPRTLSRVARLSRKMNEYATDSGLWRILYKQQGWTVNEEFLDDWVKMGNHNTVTISFHASSKRRLSHQIDNPSDAMSTRHSLTGSSRDNQSVLGDYPTSIATSTGSVHEPWHYEDPVDEDTDSAYQNDPSSAIAGTPPRDAAAPSVRPLNVASLPRSIPRPSSSSAHADSPLATSPYTPAPRQLSSSLHESPLMAGSPSAGARPFNLSFSIKGSGGAGSGPSPSHLARRGSERFHHLDWRYIYRQRMLLEKNWASLKFKKREIKGHQEAVYCLQFDDDKIVSGSRDDTIKIWDMKTGALRHTLIGHGASVLCLQYDAHYIVSGSSDATIIVWNLASATPLKTLVGHTEHILGLRFDSQYIVSCSKDKTARIWDFETGNLLKSLRGHRAAVNAIQFKNSMVVTGSGDRTIKVWSVRDGRLIRTLMGHERGIASLHFDGQTIISGSSDFTIKVWNIRQDDCLQTLQGHEELVRTVQFNRFRIVSGDYKGVIKIWDRHTNTVLNMNAHTSKVFKLQFSDTKIISCSQDQTISIWDFSQNVDTRFFS
ncbi:WD40-repeat-containing domain protein [Polychytrium aggregatum]|uniref:WD40-repeat-containing domain protein n=1 Tax=Polychytrium aggregatum TaxID=110093 RepID=UPI0022FF419D|nr:WD40-repeat-containing domain protein [Polychytrium aggregatum]KAI9209182.1 WD40-repeat-containing domain protein [Polychytrium aggregatum]